MANSHVEQQHTFFSSQTLRWLDEPWETAEDRRRFLQPSAFRIERAGAAQLDRQNVGNWEPIERSELVDRILGVSPDWWRVVFTTDAGLGKSTNLEWLCCQINQREGRQAAFLLNMTDLHELSVDGVLGKLLEQFRQVPAISTQQLSPNSDAGQDVGRQLFEQWRRMGTLTVILDGLDQALPPQITTLRALLHSDVWKECRFVLGGRPSALQAHWHDLFAATELPFQFVRLDEFTEDQQQRFLGETADGRSRWSLIPAEARGILSVPRVLEYLRDHVGESELSQIKTASDVYWKSTRHMLKEALAKSVEARKIGLAPGTIPADKPSEGQITAATRLLAAVAYAMTSQLVTDMDETSETYGRQVPNFSLIEPGSAFETFREKVAALICKKPEPGLQDQALVDQWLDALGAANDAVASGFYDSDTNGLNGILWRNKTLQEFFTALWCAKYATPEQSRTLWDWLYLAGDVTTEPYYWVNRFLAEMPEMARDPIVWVNSLEPVYRPGDGTMAGTKRSTEMLFRSWRTMHALAGEPVFDWWDCSYEELNEKEQKLKQGEPGGVSPRTKGGQVRGLTPTGSPMSDAREVLDAFRGEFQRILDGAQGADRQAAAKELTENFLRVEPGTFPMGSSRSTLSPELRRKFEGLIARHHRGDDPEDPVELATEGWPRYWWPLGNREDQLWQQRIDEWANMIRGGMEAVERHPWYEDNEIPKEKEQAVAGFRLGALPVLNEWFRLFVPGHGESAEWFAVEYRKRSETARDPVIYISWWDAWALAEWTRWSTETEVIRCRLPHEPEFEYVAKDRDHPDRDYWWGPDFYESDSAMCNAYWRIKAGATRPPEEATRSFHGRLLRQDSQGFCDLLGNVWEWMANRYQREYSRKPNEGDRNEARVLRGGAWNNDPTNCRSAIRYGDSPDYRGNGAGLRLVCVVCIRTP